MLKHIALNRGGSSRHRPSSGVSSGRSSGSALARPRSGCRRTTPSAPSPSRTNRSRCCPSPSRSAWPTSGCSPASRTSPAPEHRRSPLARRRRGRAAARPSLLLRVGSHRCWLLRGGRAARAGARKIDDDADDVRAPVALGGGPGARSGRALTCRPQPFPRGHWGGQISRKWPLTCGFTR